MDTSDRVDDGFDLSAEDIAAKLTTYTIGEEERALLQKVGEPLAARIDEFIERWYMWLRTTTEFAEFFVSDEQLAQAQHRQKEYWREFFAALYDPKYFETRYGVAALHVRIGLPLTPFFAGMNKSLEIFLDMMLDQGMTPEENMEATRVLICAVHLDTDVVASTYATISNTQIAEQSEAIQQMSTPVTAIWDRVLMLPLVGIIDSNRAQNIMAAVLEAIAEMQARVFILDISGVAIVDTAVANNLIKITKATYLMGCHSIISGLSPQIAQTIVDLDIDTSGVDTTATLRDALENALAAINREVVAT